MGHTDIPLTLPNVGNNQTFPEGIQKFRTINAEQHTRDWLVWIQHKESLCCFPCRLFWNSVCCRLTIAFKSALATAEGWPANANWRKLCNGVPEHERSNWHRECYLAWHQYVFSLSKRLYSHCFSRLSCEMSTRWGATS